MDVLVTAPLPPLIETGIAAHLPLHRLWKLDAAALEQCAPRIRALAVGGGHDVIEGALMRRFPALELVASYGVGYDHVDAAWASQNGIIVTHTPDVLNDEVADTALGLLLCTIRQLPQADHFIREGRWPKESFPLTTSLKGRRMGIVGLGRIGKAIAQRAQAFGLGIAYHGRSAQPDVPFAYYANLVEMARAVDILMVITPGGAATRGLINAEVLAALGPDGILINVARGSVVDEAALIHALQQGQIRSAGLDVFAHEPHVPAELLAMPHVVLTPHVGSASLATRAAMGQLVVDNILSWARGAGPLTPVPETPWPQPAKSRNT